MAAFSIERCVDAFSSRAVAEEKDDSGESRASFREGSLYVQKPDLTHLVWVMNRPAAAVVERAVDVG
jgi:hypothetical protein